MNEWNFFSCSWLLQKHCFLVLRQEVGNSHVVSGLLLWKLTDYFCNGFIPKGFSHMVACVVHHSWSACWWDGRWWLLLNVLTEGRHPWGFLCIYLTLPFPLWLLHLQSLGLKVSLFLLKTGAVILPLFNRSAGVFLRLFIESLHLGSWLWNTLMTIKVNFLCFLNEPFLRLKYWLPFLLFSTVWLF